MTWIRQARWDEYPLGGAESAAEGLAAPTAATWTPDPDSGHYRAALALRGVPWTRPDVPADLGAAEALDMVRTDYFDYRTRDGGGRWPSITG